MTAQAYNTILTGTLGACWGSFLNSAYYREENHLPLSTPPSHCPHCKKSIPLYLNVPVIGWALTGGKCFRCKKPVSLRYPIVEFIVAMTFIGCLAVAGKPFVACCLGALVTLYILGAVFDHKHFLIPNVTLIGALAGAAALVTACPRVVYPGISNDAHARMMMLGGGAGMMILLLAIKHAGEIFLRRTEKFGGRMIINNKGIKSVGPNGEEFFTAWPDFCYSRIVPKGNVKASKAATPGRGIEPGQDDSRDPAGGDPMELKDGDLVICDGKVVLCGEQLDLEKGVELEADKLRICRNAMGMGDIRLSASLGALVGLNAGLVEMLFFAACTGTIHGFYLCRKDLRLPFAPHLMAGTAYVIASRYGAVPPILTLLHKLPRL